MHRIEDVTQPPTHVSRCWANIHLRGFNEFLVDLSKEWGQLHAKNVTRKMDIEYGDSLKTER